MARLPEYESLYDAYKQFLNRCILSDQSLLWPTEAVWTAENVAEIKRRMIDAPIFGGELSFEEKLQQQMREASAQQWMLLADIYYIYFLPSVYITPEKKKNDIRWVAQQAGAAPPVDNAEIWEAQTHGFTRTSLRYHYKYAQFWLILLFANRLKQMEDPKSVVGDARVMQKVLDEILDDIPEKNDRAYDMRHAMLYLAFPDQYERIISTRDKERILKAYGDQIEGPVPDDLDEAIRQIRAGLSSQRDKAERSFDFYTDLKSEWRPGREQPGVVEMETPTAGSEKDQGTPYVVPTPENDDLSAVMSVLGYTKNVILYGPPGTGKTYIAKKVAEALVRPQTQNRLSETATILPPAEMAELAVADFVEWATFHQSYAYEDFVEGLRPVQSDEGPEGVSYKVVPGVFKRICSRADNDPGNKYVLVIDEINRGNIAKILGELITLLEDDKRAEGANPLTVTLPYSGKDFSVPANLYIIGTMNTADRSIALLDVALRRRFAFVELMPQPELLDDCQVESAESVVPLGDLLRSLNRGIRKYLDRDHQIGHSYFLTVAQAAEEKRAEVLEFVWNNKIVPLLEEYFYSQRDRLAELLAPFRTDVEPDFEDAQETGLDFEIGRQTGDDLVIALAKLAERGG
jgi:MoxR-like ATPase